MGRTFLFECPKCGYRAKAAGGTDRGVHFAVATVLCYECKEIYDAVTALKTVAAGYTAGWRGLSSLKPARQPTQAAPPFQAVLNRLPPPGNRRLKWVHFKPACPVSARHRIREWQSPDKCPKCGVYLERNAIPFRIWD